MKYLAEQAAAESSPTVAVRHGQTLSDELLGRVRERAQVLLQSRPRGAVEGRQTTHAAFLTDAVRLSNQLLAGEVEKNAGPSLLEQLWAEHNPSNFNNDAEHEEEQEAAAAPDDGKDALPTTTLRLGAAAGAAVGSQRSSNISVDAAALPHDSLQRAAELAYSSDGDGRRLLTVSFTSASAAGHAETEAFLCQALADASKHTHSKRVVQCRFELANAVSIDPNFRVIFAMYEFAWC